MTTFLQYICTRLFGPPAHRGGMPGDSYWNCPFHPDDTPSFHTLPRKAGKKDYWKCFGCGLWGDEMNLLRHCRDLLLDPRAAGGVAEHRALLAAWRLEYAAAHGEHGKDSMAPFPPVDVEREA